ncbi:MAG: hypothetical protein HY059_24080 [Proteobacteria bacterium]|nr:hypothetical protein [Pseudomonadota bacterium]
MTEEIGEDTLPAHMRELVALWRTKAAGRPWPDRREILFEDLVPWLGRLHLVDVLDGDFRFAVFGSRTSGVMRREFTGMRLSEIADPLARMWEDGYREAVRLRRPLYVHHPLGYYGLTHDHVGWWRAILPLGRSEKVENLLVLIQVYQPDGTFL